MGTLDVGSTLDVGGGGGADQSPWLTEIDADGNDLTDLSNLVYRLSTSGTDIDFNEDELQEISISANTLFTTTNRAIGRSKIIKITTDSFERDITFPEWDWISAIPSSQLPSSNGYLELTCWGSDDSDIKAKYTQALIPDTSQDYIDATVNFVTAILGGEALFHNEDTGDGASGVVSGGPDWRLDLQFKATRPLQAICNASRSPFVNLTWQLQYSDDNTNWTTGDSALQTSNGQTLLNAGSPSFRYCRIFSTQTTVYNFTKEMIGTTNT